jgi:hypothetical protein
VVKGKNSFIFLSQLENLQHIEMAPTLVKRGPWWSIKLVMMRKLKTVTLSMPPKEIYGMNRFESPDWSSRNQSTFATIGIITSIYTTILYAKNTCPPNLIEPTTISAEPTVSAAAHWCPTCRASMENFLNGAKALKKWTCMSTFHERLRLEAPPTYSRQYPLEGKCGFWGIYFPDETLGLSEGGIWVRRRREADKGRRIAKFPIIREGKA